MATKRELHKQIDRLRKELKENEDLLRQAAIRVQNLEVSKSAFAATQKAMIAAKRPEAN